LKKEESPIINIKVPENDIPKIVIHEDIAELGDNES
jgi:hypothetical protein